MGRHPLDKPRNFKRAFRDFWTILQRRNATIAGAGSGCRDGRGTVIARQSGGTGAAPLGLRARPPVLPAQPGGGLQPAEFGPRRI